MHAREPENAVLIDEDTEEGRKAGEICMRPQLHIPMLSSPGGTWVVSWSLSRDARSVRIRWSCSHSRMLLTPTFL